MEIQIQVESSRVYDEAIIQVKDSLVNTKIPLKETNNLTNLGNYSNVLGFS